MKKKHKHTSAKFINFISDSCRDYTMYIFYIKKIVKFYILLLVLFTFDIACKILLLLNFIKINKSGHNMSQNTTNYLFLIFIALKLGLSPY